MSRTWHSIWYGIAWPDSAVSTHQLTWPLPCELKVSLSATQPYSTPWSRCGGTVSALVHWSRCCASLGCTDVLVNGPDQVFVDRGAGLELTELRFPCEGDVRRLAQRLAASVGRRLRRCDAVRRREAGRRKSGPCSARHSGITRHLHFAARARAPKLFARRLCRLGLIDPRSGAAPGTHDRGETGVLDQWWNGLRQDDTACRAPRAGAATRADRDRRGLAGAGTQPPACGTDRGSARQHRARRGDHPD